jgi:methylthioribose-1-phosphate isomerase
LIRTAVELAPTEITVEVFDLTNPPFFNQGVEDAGKPPSTWSRAFDVVPAGLIDSLITGVGVSRAPYPEVISRVSAGSATNPQALA